MEVSKRLKDYLRRNDIVSRNVETDHQHDVARIGSDEFAIVLDNIESFESAGEVASRIIQQLVAPIQVNDQEIIVEPVLGIAVMPEHGDSVEELSRAAGLAMNKVTPNPRGEYLYFSSDLASIEQEDIQFEAHLRKAKELKQFDLHFQPQVDTTHGHITCAEALLRWEHPELGQVPPGQFIPVAEKLGIMEELSRWIIEESLRQLKDFRDRGLELARISVNLPANELNLNLVNFIRDTLLRFELNPSSIELGLSNIVLLDKNSPEYQAIKNLSELGAYFSLDNFGISSTPLSHLNHYPLNELKLDRNIVKECNLSTNKASLVRTVIAVADALALNVVAEGVETEGEFHFLANNGVRDMQGFLFSKPVSADGLRKQLEVPWFYMSQIEDMKRLDNTG
jgi:predicted signal transduction protein with EAL and GGDEF domain